MEVGIEGLGVNFSLVCTEFFELCYVIWRIVWIDFCLVRLITNYRGLIIDALMQFQKQKIIVIITNNNYRGLDKLKFFLKILQ